MNTLTEDAFRVIEEVFQCSRADIQDVTVLKKGMTNHSFLFSVRGEKYIIRVPGEGTELLIDRYQEVDTFRAIAGRGFCDDPVYINPGNGIKITRFLEGVRSCDPENEEDLIRCMKRLREFHEEKLTVDHTFNLFETIRYYERLWKGASSRYADYEQTKEEVFGLRKFIEEQPREFCLAHIDSVPDNFLFYPEGDGEGLQLTDWEYAGMQDPHVDIAMFVIYSLYEREQVDRLIDIYFEGKCPEMTRIKIYAYIAICGLLWSNWCEYKRKFGVDFGDYSVRQYMYAKEFCKYVSDVRQS